MGQARPQLHSRVCLPTATERKSAYKPGCAGIRENEDPAKLNLVSGFAARQAAISACMTRISRYLACGNWYQFSWTWGETCANIRPSEQLKQARPTEGHHKADSICRILIDPADNVRANRVGPLADVVNVLRGVLMGAADVVPGVSGGTVALIVGVYERLVQAISHFDLTLLRHLRGFRWREAAVYIDFRLLICLGTGILLGITLLGGSVFELLTNFETRSFTLAVFFGAIVASVYLVVRLIRCETVMETGIRIAVGVLGAVFAYGLTTLPKTQIEPGYGYIFFCGMIAICAMILPGISGAFILYILGAYIHLTHYLHEFSDGVFSIRAINTVAVFASGCAIGLILFSKVLRWLLAYHKSLTMSVLCGFMVGALNMIWPFQRDLTPEKTEFKEKEFENLLPEAIDQQVVMCVVLAVIAAIVVLALGRLGRKKGAVH